MSERTPGVSDRGARRYRIFNFVFDTRPQMLSETPHESWDEEARAQWQSDHERLIAGLTQEYGAYGIDRKLADFAAFGNQPFSIVAHHNALFEDVRNAFVGGSYYAALTGACALGERILNHLILDLRDRYKGTPEYQRVCRKSSFDDWSVPIQTLEAWNVLQPSAVTEFKALKQLRNRSIHFNPDTTSRLRQDALAAIAHLRGIIEAQFSAFGLQPWFIEGTLGAGFIKKEWEADPFVSCYYCARNLHLGPWHAIEGDLGAKWHFVDHPDYGELGVNSLTDEQFKDLFNNPDPTLLAKSIQDV